MDSPTLLLDQQTDLARHRTQREWMPAQSVPTTSLTMLGLPTGTGTRTLQLANPIEKLQVAEGVFDSTQVDEVAPLLMLPIGLALRTAA